jgi:hypothetical protein
MYYGKGNYMLFETAFLYTFGSDTALGMIAARDYEQAYLPYPDMEDYDRP